MSKELLTKCSVCGIELYFPAEVNVVKCQYCDRLNERPKSSPEMTDALKLANELRNRGEFEKAEHRHLGSVPGWQAFLQWHFCYTIQ